MSGYLGSFIIDDTCTFYANSHTPATGAAVDADAVPGYRIYEDETTTPLLTGSMALLDDANTVGFYSEQITLSAANGFEAGKSYCIRVTLVVGAVTGTQLQTLQIGARVDVRLLGGGVQSATDLKDFADTGYDPSPHKVAGVVLTDTLTTYTGNTVQTGDSYAKVDTEVATLLTAAAAIQAKTDNLPSDPADASDVAAALASLASTLATIASYIDTEVAAIKAKTDSLTFTAAGMVDANVQRINDVTITGDGSATPFGV